MTPQQTRKIRRKAQVWVSAVLYILVVSVAIALVLSAGLPLLDQMKDKTAYTRTRDTLLTLDKHIEDITAEGEGSQRVVAVEIKNGELDIENGKIVWEFETDAQIIEPRSRIEYGNLVVSSNIDVSATTYPSYYILENSHLSVNISKMNGTNSTSNLISSITFKDSNVTIPGNFSFTIGDDPNTGTGTIITRLVPEGNNSNLAYASVVASVNSSVIAYDLELTLESQADFITTRIKNIY
ncbi:hypothetical protein D6764_02230 [Candidatus Woesearchaeota archaeon]|nr:MAG: hypothetical protein D6764_02230 [Candidatus Woesearchaeota archaeon]